MDSLLRRRAADHERSREATCFDAAKYGHIIDWTHTSLIIYGHPVSIVSAEFQYFRVPDRERWLPLLTDIKSMGFNTVRLYIHWGYHCPAEGVYNFRGNRDIDYLLSLCVKLELFVIVAPGPYICAEVQAGGFPIWLIAKRDLRVRHMACPPLGMFKNWDQRWHDYCADYMRKIVSMLVKWERTTNPNGCIIAMQIENELRQKPFLGPGGIDDEIRLLCQIARDHGSTVPFFHNDDSPIGSWSAGNDYRSLTKAGAKTGFRAYRTDFYGFDLYFTFPPGDRSGDLSSIQVGMLEGFGVSACLNWCGIGGAGVGGSDTECISCLYEKKQKHAPPPALGWAATNQMESYVDVLEDVLQGFEGSSRYAPPIVAEAQVGWINQWGRMRTYDDTYNFFGDQFSATFQNSLMAQGIFVVNHYIAYGGTNHGTIGDTEVYSSYDYSAFIREFGLLSGRGRMLRHSALFSRSFADIGFSNTVRSSTCAPSVSAAKASIKTTVPEALVAVRDAILLEGVPNRMRQDSNNLGSFAFLRNLKKDSLRFNLIVDNVVVPCGLSKCESFIAPLYHGLDLSSYSIFACTIPVLCRTMYDGCEMWILRVRSNEVGKLVLRCENDSTSGQRGVVVNWARISSDDVDKYKNGEFTATDQDEGAATSMVPGPLEKEPLLNEESISKSEAPIVARSSTEECGFCVTFSFYIDKACVVSIRDVSTSSRDKPMLRLVCLTDEDARTFSADLATSDTLIQKSSRPFSAGWGGTNLCFSSENVLEAGFTANDEGRQLVLLRNANGKPEHFTPCRTEVTSVLPGLWTYEIAKNSLENAMREGSTDVSPLSTSFELQIEKWCMREVDWREDITWTPISYNNRDPLDHFMTSGHVAYRVRFRCSKTRGAIVLNIRHSAVIWCNGKAVGTQVCFSHNMMSAGAMHAIDVSYAGKKRHDLTPGLRLGPDENGMHEVVILVLSMGQSRSPFLLNDMRNKRGLLSARLSSQMQTSEVRWDIAGVDVTQGDDAYGSSGLPLEDEANTVSLEQGFVNVSGPEVKADSGIVFYRGMFKVPSSSIVGGNVRYPLRVQVESGASVRVMIWVNTLFLGRYVEPLGPQIDFYVPEGLIKQNKDNLIVLGVYGAVDTFISVRILPWIVDLDSGNRDDEKGQVYAMRTVRFALTL